MLTSRINQKLTYAARQKSMVPGISQYAPTMALTVDCKIKHRFIDFLEFFWHFLAFHNVNISKEKKKEKKEYVTMCDILYKFVYDFLYVSVPL